MHYSFEIDSNDSSIVPPFADGCPACIDWYGAVVPYATSTEGDKLVAFYRHRRCGHQWSCRWEARWHEAWVA